MHDHLDVFFMGPFLTIYQVLFDIKLFLSWQMRGRHLAVLYLRAKLTVEEGRALAVEYNPDSTFENK